MKKLILITLVILSMVDVNAYSETFYGRFTGHDEGVWIIYLPTDIEDAVAIAYSTQYSKIDFGIVASFTPTKVYIVFQEGYTIHATYDEIAGDIEGTWDDHYGRIGTVEGDRVELAEVVGFDGTYSAYCEGELLEFTITEGVVDSVYSGRVGIGAIMPSGVLMVKFESIPEGTYGTRYNGRVYNNLANSSNVYSTNMNTTNTNTTNTTTLIPLDDEESGGCFISNVK